VRVQQYELARPFPDSLIKQKPGKFAADYVDHGTIVQRLLEVVGPFDWEITSPITNTDGLIVGCVGTLHVEIDGVSVHISEVGDVEHPGQNSATNLKTASSDALKRAAMRVGVGLHLWVGKENYYLDRALKKDMDDFDPPSSPMPDRVADPDEF